MTKKKRFSALILLGIMASTLVMASPTPAHADRCQPEEFLLGPGGSPMDERDNPVCAILDQYVYPVLCPDPPKQTLVACLQNLNPSPQNASLQPPSYRPNYGRIYCGLYRFAFPDSTCTSEGVDPQGRSSEQDAGELEFGVGIPSIATSGPRAVSADGHFVSFRKGREPNGGGFLCWHRYAGCRTHRDEVLLHSSRVSSSR